METGSNNPINCNAEILVAGDSPTQASMIKYFLESYNYKVMVAPDGQQALDKLFQNKPALVISDIAMPVLNGYELCEKIKSDKSIAHIPVILMTSLSDPEEVIGGLSCGADSFITKPFNNEFLLSSIEKILGEKNTIKPESDKLGFEINHGGKKRQISIEAEKVVSFILNTYQAAINRNNELIQTQEELHSLNERLESLVSDRTTKLESQNALLSALINSSANIIIFSLDSNYCYTAFNENHRREMKKVWNADIQIGTNIHDYMHDAELRSLAKISIDRALNGEFFSEIQHLPEQDIYYEFNWNPILIGKIIVGVTIFISDVTERKKAENQIRLRNEQLAEVNTKKDKFLSIIAHDLRSPFLGLLHLTELMSDANEHFTLQELNGFSKSLNESANNLYSLLGNLLEWATIQKGTLSYSPQELNTSSIALQSIKLMNVRALQKGISIELEVPDNQNLYADERMIGTILRNLISNAVKFTNHGGIVRVQSKNSGNGMIEISVSDTGIGISEVIMKKLFKIDGRVGSMGTDGELSTGLGLILCKEFVDMQKGKIWVESEPGKGSTFFFTIPENNNNQNLQQANIN